MDFKKLNFKVGETYRVRLGIGKPYKVYIRAVVDKEYVAYKWYGRHKQWWHYEIEHKDNLSFKIHLTQVNS